MASHKQKAFRERYRNALADKIASKGGIWVLGEYINGKSVIRVRCEHGHEWETRVLNIQTDRWCPVCAKRKAAKAKRLYADIKAAKRHRKKINKQIDYYRSGKHRADMHRKRINAEVKRIKLNQDARDRYNKKYATNEAFRINERLKSITVKAIKGDKPLGRYEQLLGYTTDEFLHHIASLLKHGMTFENHGEWHIDHIKPKCAHNFYKADGSLDMDAIISCWSLKNMQPLWAEENHKKGKRF